MEQSSRHEGPAMCFFFLSNMVGNEIKRSVDDVNWDDMIDRQFKQLLDARTKQLSVR